MRDAERNDPAVRSSKNCLSYGLEDEPIIWRSSALWHMPRQRQENRVHFLANATIPSIFANPGNWNERTLDFPKNGTPCFPEEIPLPPANAEDPAASISNNLQGNYGYGVKTAS
jgi:hypothetical protein